MNAPCFYHPAWPLCYEDNHLLALYKPAGLLVQGDRTGAPSLLELAKTWLKERCHKKGEAFLGLVHRLDRPVAGVMLFCRTSKAAGRISAQFRSGTVRKRYLAVVIGVPKEPTGFLQNHLERQANRSSRILPAPTRTSQEARLHYRVVAAAGSNSLVEIDLETGRHHQIRVQMAHLGHPLLGDLRYGAATPLPQRQIALLATALVIRHPITGAAMTIHSPLPRCWPWPPDHPVREGPPWNWIELQRMLGRRNGSKEEQ